MTTVFGSTRRAEQLAVLLDDRSGRLSAVHDAELERLVGVVAAMRQAGAADESAVPSPTFAATLRERLMAQAPDVLPTQPAVPAPPPRARGRLRRRLVASATVGVVLVGGTAGMAAAAQQALPGEVLYPIKRGLENAHLGLSTSPADRGRDLLAQASTRLDEARQLLAGDATGWPQVPGTLEAFADQARRGTGLLLGSYADTRDPASIDAVRDFAVRSLGLLGPLAPAAPAPALDAVRQAAGTMTAIDARAGQACASCPDAPPLRLPPTLRGSSSPVDRTIPGQEGGTVTDGQPRPAAADASPSATGRPGSGSGSPQPAATVPAPGDSTTPSTPPPSATGADDPLSGATTGIPTTDAPTSPPSGTAGTGTSTPPDPSATERGGAGQSGSGGDTGVGLGDTVETLLTQAPTATPTLP